MTEEQLYARGLLRLLSGKADELNQWGNGARALEIDLDFALEYLALYSEKDAAPSWHPGETLPHQPIGRSAQALKPLQMGDRDLNEALQELPRRSAATNGHPDLPSFVRFPPIAVVEEIDHPPFPSTTDRSTCKQISSLASRN